MARPSTTTTVLLAVGTVLTAMVLWCWHPVCVPISGGDWNVPIEQRTNERMWGVQTFQKKNGQWHQCKPWLARQLFF